ncbi:beta-calactosidase [Drechmeria coniospora]|uniref:Beta-galactosidase n=1 Tax=Drechmeria coniospora TaxID=98403 RepID=A0A151GUP5_DRECN|nr:beta-calactosidase [Drechmeria coniospora]KYK60836.1 beta-calactosidase [Drechmeria coniospora]ODA83532.1 hypothetical protein RJ55_02046 [Drechmeria coniospora]
MLLGGISLGLAAVPLTLALSTSAGPVNGDGTSNVTHGNFTYNARQFLLNGEPFQIIGGQMDPQRIPKQYWRSRLRMARAMGLNTIFSYIFWNNLEPRRGRWDFDDRNDLVTFFQTVQEEGLFAVLRPGPYICGEHEWGGFPAWLSEIPGMAVRENNGPFLAATKSYLDRLGSELRSQQITRGGPILMTQLENEYGSFGKDKLYLEAHAQLLRANFETPLYTTDGGGKSYLEGGQLHGVLAVADGDPKTAFAARDKYVTDPTSLGPQLNGEYYVHWFDDWHVNVTHNSLDGNQAGQERVVKDLEWVLRGNNSFNIYMFHGGTNFAFDSGSVWAEGRTRAVTTSYDYGAPLDETGRPTKLYHKLRDLISRHVPAGSIPDVPSMPGLARVDEFSLRPLLSLFDARSSTPDKESAEPVTMESLGQSYGYLLYEHVVEVDASGVLSPGDEARDRVIVYVNEVKVGVIDRTYLTLASVKVGVKRGDILRLLVENVGRVDYSQKLRDQRKGIVGNVTIGRDVLRGWSMYSLPMSELPSLVVGGEQFEVNDGPVFYTGSFELPDGAAVDETRDTLLSFPAGVKGQVWVNGINMGRYWTIGPQQSLYVPGCYLKPSGSSNDVVVLELEPKPGVQLTGRSVAVRKWFNNPDPDAP